MSGLFEELKRRNVLRVGLAYLVASWLLLQMIDIIGPILNFSDEVARYVLFFVAIGFLPALIIAWVFEWTTDGVKLESDVDRSQSMGLGTAGKLDRAIIIIFLLAVGFLLFDKLALDQKEPEPAATVYTDPAGPAPDATGVLAATHDARKSVAILPFVAMSNGPDDDYFSDGLTEEIINALAQLPDLLVTARTSAFHFKGQNVPIEDIARQLGVAHIVEGSVRRAGEQLRITAQLIRAQDGFHLWSETFDRRTSDTFAVQQDIAEKITLALDVVLDDALRNRMRSVGIGNVEAFTEYQKGREFFERAHGNDNLISLLRQANSHFATAVELAPDIPDAYLNISDLYSQIMISQANGELDGAITNDDVKSAPENLRHNYGLVIRYAGNDGQRLAAEHDSALLLGNWNGLSALADRALSSTGCEAAYWVHLSSAAFGKAQELIEAFARTAACDPLLTRPWHLMTGARLWDGDIAGALSTAETGMKVSQSEWLTRWYIVALASDGQVAKANHLANTNLRSDSEQLIAKFMVAAIAGDAPAAASYQEDFLGKHGPNDFISLVMEAARGNRNEANHLARLIDSRPFGYMSLLQAIYWCNCGAPFDLDAAPVFSSMLSGSGLPWPPEKPLSFPLKDW
jgi:adenylate cyclase